MTDFFDGVFDGYRIQKQVGTLDGETIFEGERIRDGDSVWVWTTRGSKSELDPATLRERYDMRLRATRKIGTTGGALGIREVIQLGTVPGLVTEAPKGRSLDDILADSVQPRPIREVLRWFHRLLATMDAAHSDHLVHGGLTARHVYLEQGYRPTVIGLIDTEDDEADVAARRADVLSLATLLYHATTGRPPKAGFPYTGQAANPRELVDGYPDALARFLVQRLAASEDDPVIDATVFRRALEALTVDPEFRRSAGVEASPTDPSPHIIVERDSKQWRRLIVPTASAATAGLLVGIITYTVMSVRLDYAERRAAAVPEPTPVAPPVVAEGPPRPPPSRQDAWACIHAHFGLGTDGVLTPEEASACVSRSPGLTVAELADELDHVRRGLSSEPSATDAEASADRSYRQLFGLGADEVAMHVRYRLDNQLPMAPIDSWVTQNLDGAVAGVVRTLAARNDTVASWARGRLGMPP